MSKQKSAKVIPQFSMDWTTELKENAKIREANGRNGVGRPPRGKTQLLRDVRKATSFINFLKGLFT